MGSSGHVGRRHAGNGWHAGNGLLSLNQPGTLYVVATPIGNRGDLSPRARECLHTVAWVACEDTRHSRKLFDPGQTPELISYHDHNETFKAETLLQRLHSGESGALICDAGTPGLSDPGFRIVRACRKNGIPVLTIPGPNAVAAALSISGLPSNGFLFVGFLAAKTSARQKFFTDYANFPYTLVLYESCHRIAKAVADIISTLGEERTICVARELTKEFETVLTGTAASILPQLTGKNLKGEFVLLIAPEDFTL